MEFIFFWGPDPLFGQGAFLFFHRGTRRRVFSIRLPRRKNLPPGGGGVDFFLRLNENIWEHQQEEEEEKNE